jgi:O-antigen ligase
MFILFNQNPKYKDQKVSISLMSIFLILIVQLFLLSFFQIFGTKTGLIIQIFSKIIIALLFSCSLKAVIKENTLLIIYLYLSSIIIIFYNYLVFPNNIEILNNQLFDFLGICLICFIYSYSIDNTNKFMHIFEKFSILIFIIGFIIGILNITNYIKLESYSMSFSYYMLLPAIYFLNIILKKNSIKYLIAFIITLFLILLIGSRGAILCILIYFILFLSINIQKQKKRSLFLITGTMISIFIFWFYRENIINYLVQLNQLTGIKSRTLNLLLKNIYYTGREHIYVIIKNKIIENPIIGIGLAGDRFYLNTYSHNIILEILSGFGIIIGTLIIIGLIFVVLKSILIKDKKKANVNLIWLTIGFIPLLLSGSYLISFPFWIYLGIALKSIIKKTSF